MRESDPIYAREGLVHPGALLRLCNLALQGERGAAALDPHRQQGGQLRGRTRRRRALARARVAANYERKGHRLVDLDALVIANGERVVARVLHTAVYQLRQLA